MEKGAVSMDSQPEWFVAVDRTETSRKEIDEEAMYHLKMQDLNIRMSLNSTKSKFALRKLQKSTTLLPSFKKTKSVDLKKLKYLLNNSWQ